MTKLATSLVLLCCVVIVAMVRGQPPGPPMPHPPPGLVNAQVSPGQRAQLEEMQRNWTKLRKKMCDMPSGVSTKLHDTVEACNKINHVYQIQVRGGVLHQILLTVYSS